MKRNIPLLIILVLLLATSVSAQNPHFTAVANTIDNPGTDTSRLGESVAFIESLDSDDKPDLIVAVAGQPGVIQTFSSRFARDGDRLGGLSTNSIVAVAALDDADGIPEFIAGAPGSGSTPGEVVICAKPSTAFTIVRSHQGMEASFGIAVDSLGDVNGDGEADYLIGAPDQGTGRVFLHSGVDGSLLHTLVGSAPVGRFGFSARSCADLDGDGLRDVIVGAWGENRVRVFSSADASLLLDLPGPAGSTWFGYAVDEIGDVNVDGVVDFIVGSPSTNAISMIPNGRAECISGADGTRLWVMEGNSEEVFGVSVSEAGDMDGDGVPDALVGGSGSTQAGNIAGVARVLSGVDGSVIWDLAGSVPGEAFGLSVAGGRDVDGDLRPDVVVGAPAAVPGQPDARAHARIYTAGQTDIPELRYRIHAGDQAHLGNDVEVMDDVDGDGVLDIACTLSGSGFLRMVSGVDGSQIWQQPLVGAAIQHTPIAKVDDCNGDGLADLIVGLYVAGEARVFSGSDGSLIHVLIGPLAGPAGGSAVRGIADINGDGLSDFAVAAGAANLQPEIRLHSGADGAILQTVLFSNDIVEDIIECQDLNGDGRNELLAIAGTKLMPPSAFLGHELVSGLDGSFLQFYSANFFGTHGLGAVRYPDADGDGVDDLLFAYKGVFGSTLTLRTISNSLANNLRGGEGQESDMFGDSLALVPDINGDGFDDVLVGSPAAADRGPRTGKIEVRSGLDFRVLARVSGRPGERFGHATAVADLDGDGSVELIVGAPATPNAGFDPATVPTAGSGLYVYTMAGVRNEHPGSFEDLRLEISVDGGTPIHRGSIALSAGQLLGIGLDSPGQTWSGSPVEIFAQAFPSGTPPSPVAGFPEIQINPIDPVFNPAYGAVLPLLPPTLGQPFGTVLLPAGGMDIAFLVPPGLGQSIMLQALALSPLAHNGFFAASDGVELRF